MWPPPEPSQCPACKIQDASTSVFSLLMCLGLVISYLPQHLRIIRTGTSQGFSPWYLLLGATSSASGMLNMLVVQWPIFRCCSVMRGRQCFQSLLGFIQVSLQWLLFTFILVLFLVYFPHHLKYQRTLPAPIDPTEPPTHYGATENEQGELDGLVDRETGDKARITTTPEWRLAVTLSVVVALHLSVLLFIALAFLITLPPRPLGTPAHPFIQTLATFFGLSGTALSISQYAPQIYKTYRAHLVGALSTGTMFIQVPGSLLFVVSLTLQPGTDWTSWLVYAVTGLMQAGLLTICLCWRQRQKRLGVDDFGNPVQSAHTADETRPLVNSTS